MNTTAITQVTQDHMLGSGALSWSWWLNAAVTGADTPAWEAALTIEDPYEEGKTRTAVVSHDVVMTTARLIVSDRPQYASDALVRECRHLLADADEADFDASSANELLQVIVLGKIAYG